MSHHPIVSLFRSSIIAESRPSKNLTWKELHDWCSKDPQRLPKKKKEKEENEAFTAAKAKGIYFTSAICDGKRKNDNIADNAEVIVLDIDRDPHPTAKKVHKALKQLKVVHIIYSSASPGRYRILVKTRSFASHDRKNVGNCIILLISKTLGIEYKELGAASESKNLSQAWFLPQTTNPKKHRFYSGKGKPFNWKKFKKDGHIETLEDLIPSHSENYTDDGHDPTKVFIDHLQSGTIHQAAKVYAGWVCRTSDQSPDQILNHLTAIIELGCSDPAKIERWIERKGEGLTEWFDANVKQEVIDEEWSEPLPLIKPAELELTDEMMPASLWDMVKGISDSVEVPIELPFICCMTAVAGAIQGENDIQISQGHTESLSFWGLAVSPPGTRKSRVETLAMAPIRLIQNTLVDELLPIRENARLALRAEEDIIKSYRSKLKSTQTKEEDRDELTRKIATLEEEKTPIPPLPTIWVDDHTPEALAKLMGVNDGRMIISSAEGGIFETMAGRYSNGTPNIDLYLKSYSQDSAQINRAGKEEAILLPKPTLSLGLTIQPVILENLSKGKHGFKAVGLVERFLILVPDDNVGTRTYKADPLDPRTACKYHITIERLYRDSKRRPYTIQLSKKQHKRWRDEIAIPAEKSMLPYANNEFVREWVSKFAGRIARYMGIFHHLEVNASEKQTICSESAFGYGMKLAPYILEHGTRGRIITDEDPLTRNAKTVVAWIQKHSRSSFKTSDCFRSHQAKFGKTDSLRVVLRFLAEYGYLRLAKEKLTGERRKTEAWEVNPSVFKSRFKL